MRIRTAAVLVLAASAMAVLTGCGVASSFFRQYEYEEEMYLSLDGSATIYVNSSMAALNALRGSTFDTNPDVAVDREAVRAFYTAPGMHVGRMTTSRRRGRRYVHVRIDVDDIRTLTGTGPFSWSSYAMTPTDHLFIYTQIVGLAGHGDAGPVQWSPDDLVAFRIHVPSKIVFHNAGAKNLRRGNILVWEQPLERRLSGEPLTIEARMESQSILYRTLFLFAGSFVAVAILFVVVIWWILRRGATPSTDARQA